MKNSPIGWTHHTYNPWEGCTKVSEGCANCYAKNEVEGRWGRTKWGPCGERRRIISDRRDPYRWHDEAVRKGKRFRVFTSSTSDVFDDHPSIQQEWRDDLFKTIRETTALIWILLTKRPENLERFLPDDWNSGAFKHVILMVSVENQKAADTRIPILLKIPARFYGLSVEPLIGPVDLSVYIDQLSWVIVGGESQDGARPMNPNWVRDIQRLCDRHGGAKFFFKQWGRWGPESEGSSKHHSFEDGETVYYQRGKKIHGDLLDGVRYQDHPFLERLLPEEKLRFRRLTSAEERAWNRNLDIVKRGMETYIEVGLALREIKERELFRRDFSSWIEFCRIVVGRSASQANRLIGAAQVVKELKRVTPIGVTESERKRIPLPGNESQARKLTTIKDPEKRAEIWCQVLEEAGEEQVAAWMIDKVIQDFCDRDPTLERRIDRKKETFSESRREKGRRLLKQALKALETGDYEASKNLIGKIYRYL